ncbi:MAG: LON peptidase substrate-binding domain-containing protein [Sulfitobacter sp.]
MIKASELPDTIPIFPLPGAILLPRSRLPLHIFEPRYLQMLEDGLKTDGRLIGMIQPTETADGYGDALHAIGCVGRISQFSETEDRRYLVTLAGVSRFRVLSEVEGFTPYRRCNVSWDSFGADLKREDIDPPLERAPLMDLLKRFFQFRDLSADWDTLKDADDELLINSLSMMLDFEPEDKQALLEAPTLKARRDTLVTLIEYQLRGGGESEALQ